MIKVLATNITSPLGMTTEQNFLAIMQGRTALGRCEGEFGIPEPVCASVFSRLQKEQLHAEGFSAFESLVISSAQEALAQTAVDTASDRTIFILSTTKADVQELLSSPQTYLSPSQAAQKIATHLGFKTEPIVVCNACISGASAQILAQRLLDSGEYDNAVVCGADCVSAFTLAGFLSFKALSPFPCRPFDIERLGLNLGEAAATIVFGKASAHDDAWKIVSSAQTNDAYHTSAPAPDGDGVWRAISQAMQGFDTEKLALVNVHGTATMFNDQMESKAIEHAALSKTPLLALKGYFGHTLGAAGILEAVITMAALDKGLIPATMGFEEIGVSGKVQLNSAIQTTDKKSFLKIISGFGGCNAAILYTKESITKAQAPESYGISLLHSVKISNHGATLDGQDIAVTESGKALLGEIYKEQIGSYPKFHKMDMLTKLAFASAQIMLQKEDDAQAAATAVILFNSNSSIVADRQHAASIADRDNFFPSPSVFVYTLPNITAGEIAIKNSLKAETSLYIIPSRDERLMDSIVEASIRDSKFKRVIYGWVDCPSEDSFESDMKYLTINR